MSGDLRSFIEQATGESHLRVEEDLGDGFVRLRSAEAERRQAKHDVRSSEDIVIEMLRNSRDAHARNIYVASSREGTMRKLTIIDDGDGIPLSMHERIFDARVTSKLDTMHMDLWGVHGRGMALYAVKLNADEAHVVASKPDGGTAIHVEADTEKLGERRDQSSMPVFLVGEDGKTTVRGPRNISRTVCEFAFIEQGLCSVYLGSPAEIAATLWSRGRERVPQSKIAFCNDPEELAVCDRLALATTPDEFAEIAEELGLALSGRTARRILDGDIEALDPIDVIVSKMLNGEEQTSEREKRAAPEIESNAQGDGHERDVLSSILFKDTRGLKVAARDRKSFQDAVSEAFSALAQTYYLDGDVEPQIRYRHDRIDIHIPVIKID